MTIDLESLATAIAFIVPGFLTSKLISSRSPRRAIQSSAFEDTAESILRSIYINLVVASIVALLYHVYFKRLGDPLVMQLEAKGPVGFAVANPLVAIQISLLWLVAAFALAAIFGALWDPLHFFMQLLSKSRGGLSEDALGLLRRLTIKRREQTGKPSQLWIKARMESGAVYRGEFVSSSFRDNNQERELLLANATYIAPTNDGNTNAPGEEIDFVLLNLSRAFSTEFMYSDLTEADWRANRSA